MRRPLEVRARLAREDANSLPRLVRRADHAERGPVASRRQRAGVAVRENRRPVRHLARADRPHRATRGHVLGVDRARLRGKMRDPVRVRLANAVRRGFQHPVDAHIRLTAVGGSAKERVSRHHRVSEFAVVPACLHQARGPSCRAALIPIVGVLGTTIARIPPRPPRRRHLDVPLDARQELLEHPDRMFEGLSSTAEHAAPPGAVCAGDRSRGPGLRQLGPRGEAVRDLLRDERELLGSLAFPLRYARRASAAVIASDALTPRSVRAAENIDVLE